MKRITKIEWVLVHEDGFPTEINGDNNFIVKKEFDNSDSNHILGLKNAVHFARDFKDIANVLKTHPKMRFLESIDFPWVCGCYEEKIRILENGFFFTILSENDNDDGEERIQIIDPSNIVAWAELV